MFAKKATDLQCRDVESLLTDMIRGKGGNEVVDVDGHGE
jgi:hypothetical protein